MRENSEKFVSRGAVQSEGEWVRQSKRKFYLHVHHDFVEKNAISQVGDRLYECTSLESIISLQ